jgi:hypothetical protein
MVGVPFFYRILIRVQIFLTAKIQGLMEALFEGRSENAGKGAKSPAGKIFPTYLG